MIEGALGGVRGIGAKVECGALVLIQVVTHKTHTVTPGTERLLRPLQCRWRVHFKASSTSEELDSEGDDDEAIRMSSSVMQSCLCVCVLVLLAATDVEHSAELSLVIPSLRGVTASC